MDGIFYWTGKGLNWDAYGHNPASLAGSAMPVHDTCVPDANGYNTGNALAINYYEWCQDHNKPLQAAPFVTWRAAGRRRSRMRICSPTAPGMAAAPTRPGCDGARHRPDRYDAASGTIANSPTGEAGFAFMWHSHNEREITTNNIFPGGMLMMMLVDSREFVIDESN